MATEYLASDEYPGNGSQTDFDITFAGVRPDDTSGTTPYLSAADVKAVEIVPAVGTTPKQEIPRTLTQLTATRFRVQGTPVPLGHTIRLYRATQDNYNLVDYQALQTVGEGDLDLANRQLLFVVQEAHDLSTRADADAGSAVNIANSALATAQDAVDKAEDAQADAAAASSIAAGAASVANAAITVANQASSDAADASAAAAQASADAAAVVGTANAANATANAANATANNALAVANGIAGTAQDALDTANDANATATAANATANSALTVATGIDAKAQSALDASASAVNIANDANDTANGIADTANTALANANTALTTANTTNTDLAANSNTAGKGARKVGYGVWATNFRTVHDKLRETVSVLDYGADATGTASSLAAFNAAFSNNLNVNIYVPPGTYAGVGGSTLTGGLANTWIIARGVSFPDATKINGETDLSWLPGKVFSQIGNTGTTGSGWKIGKGGLWLEQLRPASQAISEVCIVSPQGNYGVIGASRTSDNPTANAQSAIGVGGFANNDNTAQTKPVWAAYLEPTRQANTGPAFGVEIDSRNYGNTFAIDPYNTFDFTPANSPVVNLWMSTGGGSASMSASNSSAPMVVLPNPRLFQTGITFRNGSISDSRALNVPTGYTVAWWSGAGTQVSNISDKKEVWTCGGDGNVGGVDYHQVYSQRSMSGFSHLTGGQVLYEIVANGYAGLGTGYQLGGIFRWIKDGPYTTNNRTYAEIYTGGNGGTGSIQAYTLSPLYFATADNTAQLGLGSNRWTQVWAVNGTIQTSDERKKQDIEAIPDAVLDAWADVKWYQYRWKEDVAEKGAGARFHTGVIAQRVEAAFADRGLNAFEYGLLCVDQWDEQQEVWEEHESVNPDGTKETKRILMKPYRAAGDLMSVRYEEALAMEAALMRRTRDRLEARIAALEALNQ